MTNPTSTIATNREFLAMFPGGTDNEEGTALTYPEQEMDKHNTYCATFQSMRDRASQLSAMVFVLSQLKQEQESETGQSDWKGKLDKCHNVLEELEPCCRGFGGNHDTTDPKFMPRTTRMPKRQDLNEWQDRSAATLRDLEPTVQALERQTQGSTDYQACLTRLTAENEERLAGTDEEDEEQKRQKRYNKFLRVKRAPHWSSAQSDSEEEDGNVTSQQRSETQKTAGKRPSMRKKLLARIPWGK